METHPQTPRLSLVFAADLLMDHPELIPSADGSFTHKDHELEIPEQNPQSQQNLQNPQNQQIQQTQQTQQQAGSQKIRLGDCQITCTVTEVHLLQAIKNNPSSSQIEVHRAKKALERLAEARLHHLITVRDGISGSNQIFLSNLPERRLEMAARLITALPLHLTPPAPYTGIRYLAAPLSLCDKFAADGVLSQLEFATTFPDEPAPHPNEYIVLYPSFGSDFTARLQPTDSTVQNTHMGAEDYFRRIARYHAEERSFKKLLIDPHDSSIPRDSPALAAYYDALADPKITSIVVTGPAGSGKTFAAFNYAREACKSGKYLRTIVFKEGKCVLGAVKGDVQDKMAPMVEFGKDALRSAEIKTSAVQQKIADQAKYGQPEDYDFPEPDKEKHNGKKQKSTPHSIHEQIEDVANLQWRRNFTSAPYEYAQGRTFTSNFIILDEAQRIPYDQIDTLITRQGQGSKMVIMGDLTQLPGGTKAAERSGLPYAAKLLEDVPGNVRIDLSKVLRSDTVSAIVANRARVREELGLPPL